MGLRSFVAVAVGGLAAAAPTRLLAWGLPCAMSEALKRQKKKKKKKKREQNTCRKKTPEKVGNPQMLVFVISRNIVICQDVHILTSDHC